VKIDFHVHAYGPRMIPNAFFLRRADQIMVQRPTTRTREALAARIHENSIDPGADILAADLKGAQIDHAVLVGTDWAALSDNPEPETHPLRHLAHFESVRAAHPGLFSLVIGLDPRREDAVEIAEKVLASPGVRGLKLYPPMGFSPADEVCRPVYDVVERTGKFVMFHTGRASFPFDLEYGRLEAYSKVQLAHPDMTIVLAHAGFHMWGDEALEVAVGHPRTFIELSNWNHAERDRGRAFIRQAITRVGLNRVLFASDHFAGPHARDAAEKLLSWRRAFEEEANALGHDPSTLDSVAEELLGL
jgi:uncharacterized protein